MEEADGTGRKNNEHEKSDSIFIAFCNLLNINSTTGMRLSRVFGTYVKSKSCIYVYNYAFSPYI
jgi:hypothetical protein